MSNVRLVPLHLTSGVLAAGYGGLVTVIAANANQPIQAWQIVNNTDGYFDGTWNVDGATIEFEVAPGMVMEGGVSLGEAPEENALKIRYHAALAPTTGLLLINAHRGPSP